MSYMHEVEMWLSDLLAVQGDESEAQWMSRAKTEIKARILESYRNGQKACPNCKTPKGEYPKTNGRFPKSKSNR